MLLTIPAGAFSLHIPETFRYDLTWTGIKAGEATLDVRDGGDRVIITSTTRSAKWVSIFYTVDDRVESSLLKNIGNIGMGQPVNYRIRLREGRHRKNKEVIFNHNTMKALSIDYVNNERKEIAIPPRVFDPLSSFYYLRGLKLEIGKPVYVTVFDSKKVWSVEIQVISKERIRVPVGQFDTVLIKPLIKSEGIFFRKGDIYIWLTNDEKRIPVRLKTRIKIGSITANLAGGNY
ncbi:MAG TPA: DUF3108 domain-containing protein [Thermodesulfovibrionales bacterium]|jgi:hypothetical protein|nr:DUF3108 domain-containing protein [Thermodesulfovibrionales bacterium]